MPLTVNVESGALSAEEEQEYQELVKDAGFFQLAESIDLPGGGADRFLYKLSVEVDGRSHSVEVSDAAVPPELRPLLDRLTSAARGTRRAGPPSG